MSVQVHTNGQVTINGDAVLNIGGEGRTGGTPVDLSDYVKKTQLDTAVESLQNQINGLGGQDGVYPLSYYNCTFENGVVHYPEAKQIPEFDLGNGDTNFSAFLLSYFLEENKTIEFDMPIFNQDQFTSASVCLGFLDKPLSAYMENYPYHIANAKSAIYARYSKQQKILNIGGYESILLQKLIKVENENPQLRIRFKLTSNDFCQITVLDGSEVIASETYPRIINSNNLYLLCYFNEAIDLPINEF